MVPPDTLLNNRYRIVEPLGEGGMATVYRAHDTRLGRMVAIKVLHPEYVRDRAFLERFQQEAEFAASLGAHPNIVDIYDIGEDGELHYIVMELVDGRSLKDLIAEQAPFSVAETFAIGQQVASALDFAHKRGLVHRDIKPQNIIVTPEGVAKVTDFGIARSVSASQLTRTGVVLGTVHYFSPEQAQGKPAGPQTDIYSLGIILYEMLTGHLPFEAENAIGIAMQHIHSEPPSPWEYNPELPARAVATVMRALEKDPERRYRDAGEFASALSSNVPVDTGATTFFRPVAEAVPQTTAIYQPAEAVVEPPRRRVVSGPAEPVRTQGSAVAVAPPNPWRTTVLVLLGLLLAAAVAAAAFFTTRHFLGGSPPTATPTPTPTPKPKKHHRKPTATPVVHVIVPTTPPTPTPTPPPPTATPTPRPPTPTPTPKPKKPTPTPTPPPPTATPTPHPINVTPILPTITGTPPIG